MRVELRPHAGLIVAVDSTKPDIRRQQIAVEAEVAAIAESALEVHLVAADIPVPETHARPLHDQLVAGLAGLELARHLLRKLHRARLELLVGVAQLGDLARLALAAAPLDQQEDAEAHHQAGECCNRQQGGGNEHVATSAFYTALM